MQDLFHGDLGTSFSFQAPALDVVLDRLPYTITLAVSAILLTTVVAIPLGVWMARRADTARELGANVGTIAGQSMPEFWTGIMLLTVFAVLIPILPASGFTTWAGLVLPTVTVAILQIALISRMVRREMTANLASPYLTVARSRGVSERGLTWRYAMGNSAVPVVTALGTRFAAMLNGVVVVEVVFAWPGVGSLVVRALETRDYPLIQATVLVTVDPGASSSSCSSTSLPAAGPAGPSRKGGLMTSATNLPGHPQSGPAEAPGPPAAVAVTEGAAAPLGSRRRARQPRQAVDRHDLHPARRRARRAGPGAAAARPERRRPRRARCHR